MSGIVEKDKNSIGYPRYAKQTFIQNRKQSWRCDNSTDMRSGEADNHDVNLIIRQKHSDILQEIAGKMLLYWT